MSNVLFILKRREDYQAELHSHIGLSTGLYNSASFVNDMLNDLGIDSELELAIDNNCIDSLVTKHRPDYCIIEALWVVPSKFNILQQLHPSVTWIIRLHSEMPFMAGEGMAMDWLGDYAKFRNIKIACNAPRMLREVQMYLGKEKVIYLPNFYPQEYKTKIINKDKDYVDVSCFGAIRPLKNHLVQAFAALEFAEKIGKKLRFHVNAGRIEMKGEPVLHNLRGFFAQLYDNGHELISHMWTPREGFLELCSKIDIGMQCSFSETFNVVGADLVSQGVPLVSSSEIPWHTPWFSAEPTESEEIYNALQRAYKFPKINTFLNQYNLTSYTNLTRKYWLNYFKE